MQKRLMVLAAFVLFTETVFGGGMATFQVPLWSVKGGKHIGFAKTVPYYPPEVIVDITLVGLPPGDYVVLGVPDLSCRTMPITLSELDSSHAALPAVLSVQPGKRAHLTRYASQRAVENRETFGNSIEVREGPHGKNPGALVGCGIVPSFMYPRRFQQ
jgi:hypothetical protein